MQINGFRFDLHILRNLRNQRSLCNQRLIFAVNQFGADTFIREDFQQQ